ncbi:RHS repeat domain-containing protein [Thiolapillus sp.]|uniref:RHS repeat domain-containing protein n=1 Tax=Thiolapillus sp. TaxID=2017437 RepID=UPI003AF7D5E9
MAEPAKIATLLMLLSLPVAGQGEPHYAGGGYRGDLVLLGARYLNPRLSRFTTPDPARQFMSGYQYGAGTPVTLADPSGAMLPELEGSIERALEGLENEHAAVTENTQRIKAENLKPAANQRRIIRRPAPPPPPPPNMRSLRHTVDSAPPRSLTNAIAELNKAEEKLNKVEHEILVVTMQRDHVAPGIRGALFRLRYTTRISKLQAYRDKLSGYRDFYSSLVKNEHARYSNTLRELQRRPFSQRLSRSPQSGQWELQSSRGPVMETLDANLLFEQLRILPSPAEQSTNEQKMMRVREWINSIPDR